MKKSIPLLMAAALSFCLAGSAYAQKVAFTWDDLPAHSSLPQGETRMEIITQLIAAMHAEHLPPAYGFVNGVQTMHEPLSTPVLKAWRDAGFPLGNHTWSHINLNEHSVEEFEADLLKNEPLLQQNMQGADWKWLRFPYLAEGNTAEKRDAVRAFLAKHGYRIASVTMSFGDYAWNEPYARCVAKGDSAEISALEKSYLAAADADIAYRRAMSQALFGRDIPYVLLMHVGAFDARMLPRLLALYKSHGFTFITMPEAEHDPFYSNDTDLSLPSNPDTLEAAVALRKLPLPPHPGLPAELNIICK